MRMQSNLKVILAVVLLSASVPAVAQSAPAAIKGGLTLSAGGGVSGYRTAIDQGKMLGITAWGDCMPEWVPKAIHGIGIEAEMRDITIWRPPSQPNMRELTFGGGVYYTWLHFARIHPFGKVEEQFGIADFTSNAGNHVQLTRTLMEMGAGVDYRAFGNMWARAEYEYQKWPGFFYAGANKPATPLEPQGITVGLLYHFGGRAR